MKAQAKKKATLKNKLLVYSIVITTGLAMQAMKEAKKNNRNHQGD